jgi:hypothetical protein
MTTVDCGRRARRRIVASKANKEPKWQIVAHTADDEAIWQIVADTADDKDSYRNGRP